MHSSPNFHANGLYIFTRMNRTDPSIYLLTNNNPPQKYIFFSFIGNPDWSLHSRNHEVKGIRSNKTQVGFGHLVGTVLEKFLGLSLPLEIARELAEKGVSQRKCLDKWKSIVVLMKTNRVSDKKAIMTLSDLGEKNSKLGSRLVLEYYGSRPISSPSFSHSSLHRGQTLGGVKAIRSHLGPVWFGELLTWNRMERVRLLDSSFLALDHDAVRSFMDLSRRFGSSSKRGFSSFGPIW